MAMKSMTTALLDFRRARRQADLEILLARLSDRSVDLLCYEDMRRELDGARSPRGELRDLKLDRAVGRVARCSDFTRSFLPRQGSDARRRLPGNWGSACG